MKKLLWVLCGALLVLAGCAHQTPENCDGQTLVLDSSGELCTFQKAEEEGEFPLDELTFDGETYWYLQFPGDIFYYDLRESVDCEEDAMLPIPHERWRLLYHEGDLFVARDQWEMAVADYGNDENYTWSVLVEDPETEEPTTVPITVSSADISFVYGMEALKKEAALLFADIELFGTLVKTHKDGLIEARICLAYHDDAWYWRSETIDDTVEGWPEYVVKLPDSLAEQITVPSTAP